MEPAFGSGYREPDTIAPGPSPVILEEHLRQLGRKLGFWNNGFAFKRVCKGLFRDIDFTNKNMLEIGCGKGIYCLWAKIHGAKSVVGLEPLTEGSFDSEKCYREFEYAVSALNLKDIEMLPSTLQDYKGPENFFDIVLSYASINHLVERSCIELRRSAEAREQYLAILGDLRRLMKDDGTLIIVDASNRNLFADFGIKSPFCPNIEWLKHQSPEYWAHLLSQCGFTDPDISWPTGTMSRYWGIHTIPKPVSYFFTSTFRLVVRCAKKRVDSLTLTHEKSPGTSMEKS